MPQILLLKLPMEEKTQQASKQKMDTERFFLFAVETQEWMLVWGEGAKASPPSREKCQKVRGSPAARDRASGVCVSQRHCKFPGATPTLPSSRLSARWASHAVPLLRCPLQS